MATRSVITFNGLTVLKKVMRKMFLLILEN